MVHLLFGYHTMPLHNAYGKIVILQLNRLIRKFVKRQNYKLVKNEYFLRMSNGFDKKAIYTVLKYINIKNREKFF